MNFTEDDINVIKEIDEDFWSLLPLLPHIHKDNNGDIVIKNGKKGRPPKLNKERYEGGQIRKRPKVTSRIIGIDGEGKNIVGIDGEHHTYDLICASDGKGFKTKLTVPQNQKQRKATSQRQANYGLHTQKLLEFILGLPEHTLIVGFAFSYDTSQIMKDLPKKNLEQLNGSTKKTEWKISGKHYGIEYVPKKQLIIKEGKSFTKDKKGFTKVKWNRRRTIWDVFGFFQRSFVKALEEWNITDEETLERIQAMKDQRFDFSKCTPEQIEEYCFEECDLLCKLMEQFLFHVNEVELNLKRFDGAGALAGAWLQKMNIKEYLDETNLDEISEKHEEDIPLNAYFGGRFEISRIGHVGECWAYDINSAYPYICKDLPCLMHGEFVKTKKFVEGKFGVYKVSSYSNKEFALFPWRTEEGNIYYMHDKEGSNGYRWVWNPEVEMALKYEPETTVIHEGYYWRQNCNHKPFEEIERMYEYRLPRKKTGAGQVIKLIINSIYGKLAQSVGYNTGRKTSMKDIFSFELGKDKPKYQSFIWAGIITSGCRAMILDSVYKSNHNVVSIATDGILSTKQIEGLNINKKAFGAWDREYYSDMYLIQSGVMIGVKIGTVKQAMRYYKRMERYHRLSTSKNMSEEKRAYYAKVAKSYSKWFKKNMLYKTRGYSFKEVPPYLLVEGWDNLEIRLSENAEVTSNEFTRFIGMKSGILRNDWTKYTNEWISGITRSVSFIPNRRENKSNFSLDGAEEAEVWYTEPYFNTKPSGDFKKKTSREELDQREFDDDFIEDYEYPI